MLTRDFQLRVKALSSTEEGSFDGYASTYGNTDMQDDVIEPGAFRQAIIQQGKGGYPMLWAHRQDEPVGNGVIEDSAGGLIVHGQLLMSDPVAVRAYEHLKAGTVRGLSIGFSIPRGEGKIAYRTDGTRLLKEVHLHEISLVAIPANPRAQITHVKSLNDIRHLLKSFDDGDVPDDQIQELREIDRELKRLLGHDVEAQAAETLRELQSFANDLAKWHVVV